ncbi:MAG: shikimate kinase [Hyphomicrobiaceae bacterium]|nr:shikimate kinase [Hyphomicrobiaceae bacterium]
MPHDDIARNIAAKVRDGRARLKMTRKQLAALAGVSERYLAEVEAGEANASVAIIAKVAEALGQSFISLVTAGPGEEAAGMPALQGSGGLMILVESMSATEREAAFAMLQRWLGEHRRSRRGVALLGLRGAGKSTLGRLLAERHGLTFVSVTREIEARAGMGLNDFFNLGGPDAYRALENEVVGELLERDGRLVLETAGGIAGNSQALDLILASFRTVWLKASPEEHLARVALQGDTRPMRGNPKALEHLRSLLASREPEYARAECTLDTSGQSVEACLAELERLAAPTLREA